MNPTSSEKHPPTSAGWRGLAGLLGLLWVTSLVPSGVQAQTATAEAVDPVVGDVVRMLEVGIEPDLILRWLESSGKRPGPLSADDVIALSEAKAPKELIQALLDLAAAAPTSATPIPRDTPAAAAPERSASVAPGPPPAGRPDVSAAAGDCCLVDFSVEYRVTEDKEGGETSQPGRDLFVYVDGRFLARFESQGNIAARGPVPFKAHLAPGEHTLRLTRELHSRAGGRKKSDKWDHETTVSPATIPFAIDSGTRWNLDMRWVQSEFSLKHPLSWQWTVDGVEIAGEERVGAFREDWVYLCEDAAASRESGAISAWRARDRLKDCVSWDALWPGDVGITRAQVLDTLRQDDFEPDIRTVGRID